MLSPTHLDWLAPPGFVLGPQWDQCLIIPCSAQTAVLASTPSRFAICRHGLESTERWRDGGPGSRQPRLAL